MFIPWQMLCKPENVSTTRMTPYNLAVVFAPNLSPMLSTNPLEVAEEAMKANAVIETLIRLLDTTYVEGLS